MKSRVKRIIFIATICFVTIFACVLQWPLRFQTDLTSLLKLETDTGWPVQNITERFSSVINIVVQSDNQMDGEITAHKIRTVVESDDFPELTMWVNDLSPHAFATTIGKYHNVMIGTNNRNLLQEKKYADITQKAKTRVETSMMPTFLPLSADPFLLFTDYVSEIGNGGTNWIMQNGTLWQYRDGNNFYMLPISVNTQNNAKLVEIVQKLRTAIMTPAPTNVHVYMGGAPIHTAEMYNRSKIELGVISVLALIAVFVLNYMLFRRMATIIPIGISLAVGYIAGTAALFLCFGEPHILVFVFGTSLIGLGIDYGFHFMCVPPRYDVRPVHKNILHSLITTLICFVPLGFASIALLRQISVFTIVGLVTIYAFIKLFVSSKNTAYVPKKVRFMHPINRSVRLYVIWGIAVVAIGICAFARIENNMASMYRPNAELGHAEKVIGELNQSGKSAFLIVRGHDIQELLETEENIRDAGVRFVGISTFVPSLKRQTENNQMVQDLYKDQAKNIKSLLGLKKMPQFTPANTMTLDSSDLVKLRGQLERFLINADGYMFSVSSVSADTKIVNDNARIIAPAQQIQNQMEKFSNETYNLLLICGFGLVVGMLFLYGRRAFQYLMPPLFGVIVPVAILTIWGIPMTFFHLLGLFIVIGLGLDYAIFHINMKNEMELRPVFYSFLTSFIGFGLLAFTSFFLVAAMGMILALGIAVSYLVSLYLFRN